MVRAAPKRGLMEFSVTAAGEVRGADAGGEREPGERLEFVVDEECGEAAGGMLGIGEGRIAAAVVEDGAEEFVVLLIEAVHAGLQIISRHFALKLAWPPA